MQDLIQMDNQSGNQRNEELDGLRREMERRSNDRIQVFNPTEQDRTVVWNTFVHRIPVGQNVILPRYIADKYVDETVVAMITADNEKRVDKENEHRRTSGQKAMDAEEREIFDWRTNDPKLREKYIPLVYKGITEEYGKDEPVAERMVRQVTATDANIMAEIDKQRMKQPDNPPKTAKTERKEAAEKAKVNQAMQDLARKASDGSAD